MAEQPVHFMAFDHDNLLIIDNQLNWLDSPMMNQSYHKNERHDLAHEI